MPTIVIATLACMAGAFLICGIPSGLIIARHSSEHVDVRKVGSGNIGMTNVARSAGCGAAACAPARRPQGPYSPATAARSSSTRLVASQVKSASSRPKCP